MTEREAAEHPVSKGYAAFVFILLFLLYMFDYIDRMIIVSLFPFLQADWGLSDAECGMLVSAVYWSILVFAFPVSLLIDRWSRKHGIAVMAVLWSLATLACAFAGNFRHLFMARVAVGIGEAGYAPGGTAMISALFPQRRRALAMGLWNASIPLGGALGMVIGGFVAQHWGWRHAFGLVALPGLVVALLFFTVRDYQTVALVKRVTATTQTGAATRRLDAKTIAADFARTRSLWLTYLGFAANTFVSTALMSWLPTYFHRLDGLPMDQASLKGGAVMLLALVGAPLGGFLADAWQRTRPDARPLFCAVSSLFTAALLFIAFTICAGAARYAVLLGAGLAAVAYVPAAAAVTQDVVHPGLRATAYSLCVIVMHLLGSALGPLFVGVASDRWDLPFALSLLPAFGLAAAGLFLLASRAYPRDVQATAAAAPGA